jgi:ABC-2 type transport system permease protein
MSTSSSTTFTTRFVTVDAGCAVMMNLIRSEFFKLRTIRLNLVMIAVGVLFVVVVLALVGAFAKVDGEFESGPTSADVVSIVGVASVLAGLLVSVVSVVSVTSEFGHGTIRPTLVATPNRVKVFAAKALVLAVVALVVGAVTGLVSYLVGFALLSSRGADELNLFDSDGTLSVLVGIPVFFLILSMFGYGLGLLIRNSPAAVAVAVLWPLVIETVMAAALGIAGVDDPTKFLPYQSAFALTVADADDFANGRVGGALYFGVVVAVLVVVATFINTRRDV